MTRPVVYHWMRDGDGWGMNVFASGAFFGAACVLGLLTVLLFVICGRAEAVGIPDDDERITGLRHTANLMGILTAALWAIAVAIGNQAQG